MNNNDFQSLIYTKCVESGLLFLPTKQTSICSFVIWNISKALEKNPCLDLRHAMHSAHERLERESREGSGMISQPPDGRYLTCALLAWQQLGHKDVDSLYQFIEDNGSKIFRNDFKTTSPVEKNYNCAVNFKENDVFSEKSLSLDTISNIEPVVKLPVETKIVMHVENPYRCSHGKIKEKTPSSSKSQNTTMNKIDAACCMDSACLRSLTELDASVNELRARTAKLARREAERVELLERAEQAWKDLELGYQRRLYLAKEKEDDLEKQIKKTIEERNNNKTACISLMEILKEHGTIAETETTRLASVEKELCERACVRLQLNEEYSRQDAALVEQLCRNTQLDRDLMIKEEQAQRRVLRIKNDIESARCLSRESERAMRAELSSLKDQIKHVSDMLYIEKAENINVKTQLEELRQEKADIVEDLDGCQLTCDGQMQAKIDELRQKRAQFIELKQKVYDCKCKLPQDAAIEVKRTPSFAALCQCSPEDNTISESCSCTSLRSQLLSNLLADLFGGLQSELSDSGFIMPCHLLKCLEDKHNWDHSSVIKSNLLNFFAQLLVKELDIAIATSIEKYHAKWIGKSCVDKIRAITDETDEGRQEQAIERRAQKLASKLAEQLYNEKAEQLTRKTKNTLNKGSPPCHCKNQPAAFPCIVNTPLTPNTIRKTNNDIAQSYFKRTMQDVTQLRLQIEDLKKNSVKKEDLWHMKEKITKIVQKVAKPNNIPPTNKDSKCTRLIDQQKDIEFNYNGDDKDKTSSRKYVENESFPFNKRYGNIKKNSYKTFKQKKQSYAVNLCLCETNKQSSKAPQNHKQKDLNSSRVKKPGIFQKNTLIMKKSKPMTCSIFKENSISPAKISSIHPACPSQLLCFHKRPSNTSIDNLLNVLLKWRAGLIKPSRDGGKNCKVVVKLPNKKNEFMINDSEMRDMKSTRITYTSNNEMRDLSTDNVNTLIHATESIYIGEIDLDKSKENACICKVNTIHDDGKDLRSNYLCAFQNTDFCECVKIPVVKSISKQDFPENEKLDLHSGSQFFSVDVQKDEMKYFQNNKSKRSVSDSFVCAPTKKSQIFSSGDYDVKFLGATLVHNCNKDNTKKGQHHLMEMEFNEIPQETFKQFQNETQLIKSHSSSQIQCNVNVCRDRDLAQCLSVHNYDKNRLTTSNVQRYNESKCVCCDKNNDGSNDLELNVFNLLEEHLKEKFNELEHKCDMASFPRQEEKELITSILKKVKQVISESTNPLSCSCTGKFANKNHTHWSRAYNLLQEYIKVKIKRVQCLCEPKDENENPSLSNILDKVSLLIENDFQRLKDRYKSFNNHNIYLDHQTSPVNQEHSFTRQKIVEDSSKFVKYKDDISCQVSCHISGDNKSCEAVYRDVQIFNTLEKKISCELKNANVIDCSCRNTNKMCNYFDKEIFVNLYTKYIPNDATNEVCKSPKSDLSLSQSLIELNNKNENKDRYFGYTLNCSCDQTLGQCYCIKSTMKVNNEKIDLILKTEIERNQQFMKTPYIMSKVLKEVNPEPIIVVREKINSISHSTSQLTQNKIYCDKDSSPYTCENIYLKRSEEKCVSRHSTACTINDFSIDTNISYVECSHCRDNCQKQINNNDHYHISDTQCDKHLLFDSLCLPTDDNKKYKKDKHFKYSDDDIVNASENCECERVPVCHVKMLIEHIEKKIVESKGTMRIDPVRSEFLNMPNEMW